LFLGNLLSKGRTRTRFHIAGSVDPIEGSLLQIRAIFAVGITFVNPP
jgi:hypothetical protein